MSAMRKLFDVIECADPLERRQRFYDWRLRYVQSCHQAVHLLDTLPQEYKEHELAKGSDNLGREVAKAFPWLERASYYPDTREFIKTVTVIVES